MKNSYTSYKVLQGDYGYGWTDLCKYDDDNFDELCDDLKFYIENEPLFAHRIITVVRKDGE